MIIHVQRIFFYHLFTINFRTKIHFFHPNNIYFNFQGLSFKNYPTNNNNNNNNKALVSKF